MAVLVDTNVLIFSIQQGHPWQEASIKAIEQHLAADETVYVLPQNIAEFWNVCTRPADKNGLGLTPLETELRLKRLDLILTPIGMVGSLPFGPNRPLIQTVNDCD